ncbi:ninjurin-1-like isoform X2 [Physella acuta]|nr:ninjurin-1-like isoform X2 [Physella acuta]
MSEAIPMGNSTVHPRRLVDSNNEEGEGRRPETDDSDGNNPLTPESFAPLLSTNQFLVRKMASQALMDVALMMANISQLRTLVVAGPDNMEYFYALITLVGFSLAAQIIFAILIFIIWVRESDQHQRHEYLTSLQKRPNTGANNSSVTPEELDEDFRQQRITNHLNYVTMVLVFTITVANMFITGFGIKLEVPNVKSNP